MPPAPHDARDAPRRRLSREACQRLQRLPPEEQRRVREVLPLLGADFRHTALLHGPGRRWRRRLGRLRVIWTREPDSGDVLVLRVAYRKEAYVNLPPASAPAADEELPPGDEDAQGLDEAERVGYYADGCLADDRAWYAFLYGDYRYRPHLSREQLGCLERLLPLRPQERGWPGGVRAVESGPGTGKSVCAAHMAALAYGRWAEERACYVALIVPPDLVGELRRYPAVGSACQQGGDRFFLGDYLAWAKSLLPREAGRVADDGIELEALRLAGRYRGVRDVGRQDLSLYRAFVLGGLAAKDVTFQEYRTRVGALRRVSAEEFERRLAELWAGRVPETATRPPPPLHRHQVSGLIACRPPGPPPGTERALLVCDEVQDLFRADRDAVQAVCAAWRDGGVPTHLLVLGDLNQRVEPTGFSWHGFPDRSRLSCNYRNSGAILDFAEWVLALADRRSSATGSRHNRRPPSGTRTAERGEPVRLLVWETAVEARAFLSALNAAAPAGGRELLRRLAQQVKVLTAADVGGAAELGNLLLLTPKQAKGREFASCVAYRLFAGEGDPAADEVFRWYTLLTRAQSRLLLVVTRDDLRRLEGLGPVPPACRVCTGRDAAGCVDWVLELNSEVSLAELPDDVESELLAAFTRGAPYLDTYLALARAGVDPDQFEARVLGRAPPRPPEPPPAGACCGSLRCLLLRLRGRSWDAAREAAAMAGSDPDEAARIIRAVAADLEGGRRLPVQFPLEAARMRGLLLGEPWPPGYPLPGLNQSGEPSPAAVRSLLRQCLRDFLAAVAR